MRKIPKEKSRSAFRIVIYILHARGVPVKKIRPTFSDRQTQKKRQAKQKGSARLPFWI